MLRGFHLADFVTLGNAACGTAGVVFAMVYMASGRVSDFLLAAAMAPLAFAFDWLDGRVAPAALACERGLEAPLPGGAWDIAGWTLHPLVLMFALSGTLMISKTLRIPKI